MRFCPVTSCFILKYNSLLLSGHLPFPNVSPARLSFFSRDHFHLFLIAPLCVYIMCVSLCLGPECCVPPCTEAIIWNTQISLFKLPLSGSFSLIESDFSGGFFFHLEWCFDNSQFVASLCREWWTLFKKVGPCCESVSASESQLDGLEILKKALSQNKSQTHKIMHQWPLWSTTEFRWALAVPNEADYPWKQTGGQTALITSRLWGMQE